MEVPGLTITRSPSRYRLAFHFILAFRAGFAIGSPPRYSTPPLASNSPGIVPARNNSTAGCQSPSSGSLVHEHAMAPACWDASRAAKARTEPADGQLFGRVREQAERFDI